MDDDPDYDIAITRLTEAPPACERILRKAIEIALQRHAVSTASLSVALVGDAHIAELNLRHLKREGPTDVLAFDLRGETGSDGDHDRGPGESSASTVTAIDGEVVVSVETAKREAEKRELAVEAELALYVVHGVLHLLGYDDGTERGAQRMHTVEDALLEEIGIGNVYRDES
ncbi:MAG: rRNA maturation RNase YbeY [Phycisphaerae bacterium]|jgi:probable rRNA maturation factor